jgi:hypothetical protein
MRRKRNWILKRLVLGFAVAALVVPSAAMARVDEGGAGQPNSSSELVKGSVMLPNGFTISDLKASVQSQSNGFVAGVTDFPSTSQVPSKSQVKAGDYGMPRAMPSDYALQRGDAIEIARLHERNTVRPGDLIENVRLQPRTVSTPQVASTGFDWGDAGIGAGILLGLVLVGGAAFYATRQVGKPQTA